MVKRIWNNNRICIFIVLVVLISVFVSGADTLSAGHTAIDTTGLMQPDSIVNYADQRSDMDSYFFRVIWVTLFILALIIVGFYIYRKSMGKFVATGKNQIKVVARYTLGPKQMLLVVHVERQKLLLGVTEQGINLLKDFGPAPEDEQEIEPQQTLSAGFGSILSKLKKND
jgi:flagellar biosynthetic protein FliO